MNPLASQKLLQQQMRNTSSSRLVNSPHAKYDSKGQLKCIVCGIFVKSAIVWQAHVAKKSHIQNLNNLEIKQKQLNDAHSIFHGVKRKAVQPPENAPPSKKVAEVSTAQKKPKGILKGISTYSSSDSEEEDVKPTANALPANFFDKSGETNLVSLDKVKDPPEDEEPMAVDDDPYNPTIFYKKSEVKPKPLTANSGETLPEGFFDDPVQDAKARKVEYVDKDEAEWETFMKEVSAAETTSKAIIDEDAEEAAKRNQILDVEESILLNKKVILLDKAIKSRSAPVKEEDPRPSSTTSLDASDTDSDDEEFSNSISWRNKNFSL